MGLRMGRSLQRCEPRNHKAGSTLGHNLLRPVALIGPEYSANTGDGYMVYVGFYRVRFCPIDLSLLRKEEVPMQFRRALKNGSRLFAIEKVLEDPVVFLNNTS